MPATITTRNKGPARRALRLNLQLEPRQPRSNSIADDIFVEVLLRLERGETFHQIAAATGASASTVQRINGQIGNGIRERTQQLMRTRAELAAMAANLAETA